MILDTDEKIYVDLVKREGTSLSETIRDPRVVSNHKNNSKVRQAVHSEVKYSETECIVRYLKMNDSFVKTFSLDHDQYSAFNYILHQLTGIQRFFVEDQGILSIDTTFEICEGLYLTDTSYPNMLQIDKSSGKHPQFTGSSFGISRKMKRHTEDLWERYLLQVHHWHESQRLGMIWIEPLLKVQFINFQYIYFLKTPLPDCNKSFLSPRF